MSITLDELHERARPWIEPVTPDAPAGIAATADARHESVRNEVGKLEALDGPPVAWNVVLDAGGDLLREKSKDLLIASYVALGLYVTGGLEGLATGVTMLTELVERY